mgnify:CR=1 FL=1
MKSHASMNRIYRLVFNVALGIWVAVAENAKGRGKGGRAASALLTVLAILSPSTYAANAADAIRTGGAGTVTTVGNTTTINQTSQRLALDWTQLSTVAGEALSFVQPNAQAIALNRITGTSASSFLGSLTANGQVFILNPNGILFGAGSQVNVGGIVASTLGMNPTDFMNGSNTFTRTSDRGSVVNQGSMTAAQGGYLAMLAPEVRNEGVMTATLGTALLAAGNKVTLNLDNGSLLGYSIDQGAINALAENKQLIKADGGQVLLSAKALDALTTATVNNTGVIEARTLQNVAGRIMLMGDMAHGTVNVGGTLDASAPSGGNGGFVETSAAQVKVATGAQVTTRAVAGQTGTWLIDPADYNISASGGDISGATLTANLVNTSVSILSSSGAQAAGGGDINVNDAFSWSANTLTLTAARNINFNAVATATGTAGLVMNTATANGTSAAVPGGRVNMALGAGGFTGRVDMATGTSLSINGESYTIVNSLGAAGVLSANDLQGMYGNQNARFVLGSNIDASATSSWNGGAGFYGMPNYKGRFNGLGHTITGLTINTPNADEVGLFGQLQSNGYARVANVGLVGGSFTGRNYVGSLVGWAQFNSGAVISNNYSSATVNGSNHIGGLVGAYSSATVPNNTGIFNSYATGDVTGTATNFQRIGGLVGSASLYDPGGPLITNSYATGTVTAGGSNSMAGGLVGNSGLGIITGSHATGQVNGAGNAGQVGGLIGYQTDTVVTASYASGAVRGSSTSSGSVGGLVGYLEAGTISNSYASGTVAPSSTGATGAGVVGGLVGFASAFNTSVSTITNSYATGAVSGPTFVGGLLGSIGNGSITISRSYATGTVTGTGSSGIRGGLVGGTSSAGTANISNSYATGNIIGGGGGYAGGMIGIAETNTTIANSYASNVVAGGGTLGGLAGYSTATLTNNFWNSDTATTANGNGDAANNVGAAPLTSAQFRQSASFNSAGWSASNVGGDGTTWRIYEGQTGPLLRSFLTPLNMDLAHDGNGASLTQAGAYSTPGTADTTKLFGTAAAPGTLTLASSGVAGNYLASAPVSGLFSQQNGYDILPTASRTIASAGSAAGDVQLGNDISFTNGTLAVSAANNIDLNGKAMTASSGTLQINSGTVINQGAVNVDTFRMAGGTWQQVGGTPAAFAVRDFGISGGTFIRALGGDGLSAGTAYQLTDVYGLQGAGSAGMLNKNYKLANNIDASGTALWNGGVGGAGFDPIGDNTTRFTGTFDGNNKTVSNLTINRPGQDYVGLMGDLGTGGTVTNVGLVNVSVDGLFYVGGIAGNSGGTISNSYATGRVEGQGEAGGLVGVNSGAGQISNSYVTSSVTGYSYVGGLVGTNGGTISESYATGSVTGNYRVGGLVGTNWGAGQISNSYATGSVSGNDYVGGLVSINDATISNSYATGSVGGIGHVGGLVGINYETISNSFWNTQTSGQTTSAGGTGMTTVEMMQAATFTSAGWSASNVGGDGTTWRIYEGNSGPLLRGLMTGLTLANTTVTYNGGTQQGATTADARVLGGSNASGRNFGYYANSYYSNQQGVDIIGGSLAVNKANLVLSTSNVTKIYDGGLSALGIAMATASTALLGSDTATGGSFAFINKNAGAGNKAVSTTGVTVNDGNSGNNYNVSYANNTTSTITPKALTVSGVTAGNKVYDRTDSATVNTGSASYSGLVSGDLLAVNATGTFTDKNVANGKTVNLTSSYTGADVNNYIITSQATTTANITPKALTVSGITAANKIYDQGMGSTVSTTGAVLGGFIAGDVLAVNATGVFLDKNAATGKTVNLISSYTGADVGNYTITDQSTTVASITPKVLTVSGVTASNKTYDQTTAATVSTAGAVLGGLIAGDVLAVNATGMFTDKNAATLKTVNLTSNYTGADAGNYAITNQASTTANITPKSLTVSGATAQNKVYDATTAVTITFSDNRIAGDVLGFTSAANFSDKNVGTAKTVNYSGVAATGVDAGNYTLSATSGVSSANITRAPLNITANNDGRLAGAPYSGGNGVVYSGLVGGETASVLTGALAFSGNSQGASTAGSYAITPGGQAGSNYAIAFNNGVLTLTPAPVPAPAAPVSAIANALRKFTPDIAGFDPEESFSAAKNSVQTSFKVDGGSGGSGGGSSGSGGGAGGANTPEGKLNAAANGDAGDAADEN